MRAGTLVLNQHGCRPNADSASWSRARPTGPRTRSAGPVAVLRELAARLGERGHAVEVLTTTLRDVGERPARRTHVDLVDGVRVTYLATPLRYRWMGVTPTLPLALAPPLATGRCARRRLPRPAHDGDRRVVPRARRPVRLRARWHVPPTASQGAAQALARHDPRPRSRGRCGARRRLVAGRARRRRRRRCRRVAHPRPRERLSRAAACGTRRSARRNRSGRRAGHPLRRAHRRREGDRVPARSGAPAARLRTSCSPARTTVTAR